MRPATALETASLTSMGAIKSRSGAVDLVDVLGLVAVAARMCPSNILATRILTVPTLPAVPGAEATVPRGQASSLEFHQTSHSVGSQGGRW